MVSRKEGKNMATLKNRMIQQLQNEANSLKENKELFEGTDTYKSMVNDFMMNMKYAEKVTGADIEMNEWKVYYTNQLSYECQIEDLYAEAYNSAINNTIEYLNDMLGLSLNYASDWARVHELIEKLGIRFDVNGEIVR